MVISLFFLVGSYALNALSPVLAGYFQVTATIIKLVPLVLMAVVGTIFGLTNGMTVQNFTTVVAPVESPMTALFTAVVATAFAYEGWIIATSINAELRDAKKNLPKALLGGTIIVMVVYIAYYIGLAGTVSNEVMMAGGQDGAKIAFEMVFSKVAGTLLFVFVIISCLGTLNGLMLGCTRGLYSVAARGRGPRPEIMSQIDDKTNMPTSSAIVGLLLCAFWFVFFYGANLPGNWFGFLGFDTSELPIVATYALYIPIFVMMIVKEKDLGTFKGKIMPILAILGSVFMVYAAIVSHQWKVVAFLIMFAIFMLPGVLTAKKKF
jgi:APA family basic amino acid/polyamine antiporter